MKRLLLGLALLSTVAAAQEAVPDAKVLFSSTLDGLDGKPVALAALRGKPLVVNFWARWCGPCREEIPELAKRAAAAPDIDVVGIAIEDQAEAVRDFARAYGMDYSVLLAKDKGIPLLQALGDAKAGLPFTLAVDRSGRVAYSKLGRMSAADMDAAFAAAAGRAR